MLNSVKEYWNAGMFEKGDSDTLHGYNLNFYVIPDEAKRSSGICSATVGRFLHSQE